MRMIAAVVLAVASAVGAEAWSPPARAQDTRGRISDCTHEFTISGSYVLVKNLHVSGDCLSLSVPFLVTIDLNGFGIFGAGATGVGINVARVRT